MIETNYETNERRVFCDRCQKELTEKLVSFSSGDCICEECFNKEHKFMTPEEYLKGIN